MIDFRGVDWHAEAERACVGKLKYSAPTARAVARDMRSRGLHVSAYRCPWCDARWHVGHVPSPESLERIAAAIRNRTNEDHNQET